MLPAPEPPPIGPLEDGSFLSIRGPVPASALGPPGRISFDGEFMATDPPPLDPNKDGSPFSFPGPNLASPPGLPGWAPCDPRYLTVLGDS